MIARHLTRRAPKKTGGFSFGRFPSECGTYVTFRMFRRDHTGRLHVEIRQFSREQPVDEVAAHLWHARIRQREFVDSLQLEAWGMVA